MTSDTIHPAIQLAARIAEMLAADGVRCALIGAASMAIHNYIRVSDDVDLITNVNPFLRLRPLADRLRLEGFEANLHEPDSDDPLGGVLRVRDARGFKLDIVNYYNPRATRPTRIGTEALKHLEPAHIEGVELLTVDLAHLIALKLYAGGPKAQLDVLELIAANPDLDLDKMSAVARGVGLEPQWRQILEHLG